MGKNTLKNKIVKNTSMLYIMNITKIILPLMTLPYLTRILTKDNYGVVSYVKAVMQYMQVLVDFGFLLSATKDIVNAGNDREKINRVIGDTLLAKFMLLVGAFFVMLVMIFAIPILKKHALYTILSFIVVALTCFLMDFLFRGIEEMQIITIRYVIMRSLAAVLTFVFVKNDADLLWIPMLDILGSLVAILLVVLEMKKRGYHVQFTCITNAYMKLKEATVYFVSNMASTTFTALNTLLIGIFLTTGEVAEWSLCLQMVSAVMSLYTPVTDGIYPYMVKSRDLNLVKRTAAIFMTAITAGCVFTFFAAKWALLIVGGEKYITAVPLLRSFIPLLFFSFPAMLMGWPALGAINRVKETTKTTIYAAALQIAGLVVLLAIGQFTVMNLAILRGSTEACMFMMRFVYCRRFRSEFA